MDLTPIQKQEKRELREAYAQFWTNNAAFKRGWARPVAQFDEVREFLDEIAEYVVLLRNQLDSQTGTPAIRSPKAGAATEYLWTMEYNPVQEKERFVKDMVLATFSDANGYVEGLTEERILKHIQECKDKKKKAFESLRNNLGDAFQKFDAKIKGVLNQKHAISQKEATVIQKIIDAMNNFSNQLTVEEQPQAAPTPTPAVPAEESMRQESERKEQDELLRTISELNKERLRKEAEAVEQELKQAQAEQEKILKEKESQGLIQIEQVAHDVEGLKSNVHSLATDTEALDVESLLKNPTEGIKTIDTLERKCLTYTEELLKDLSTLDQVMGSEQTRPLRKQQVHSVQELMKEIDQVNEKLHGVMYQLKQEQHQREQEHLLQQGKIPEELKEGEQKKEETKNEEPKEAPKKLKTVIGRTPDGRAVVVEMTPEEQQQLEKLIAEEIEEIQRQQQAKEEMGEEVTDGDEAKRKKQKQEETTALPSDQVEDMETSKGWEDLILHPRFETQDHPLFFVLASYIPGMRQEDLSIQFSRNTGMLSVKGMRIPTPEEIEAMKKQVKTMHTLDPKGIYFPIDEDEETSLKRVGAGRYGTFQQSFRIPKGLHPEKMVATYNGGVLQILLPKDQALKKSKKPNKKNFDIYSTPLPIYNDKEMWWQ